MAKGGVKGHPPFFSLSDSNQMVSVPQVQFGKDCGSLERLNNRTDQRRSILVLNGNVIKTTEIDAGTRVLSVLERKKKTVQRVEEEERIMPAASLSGLDLRYMKGRMDMKGSREFQSDCRRVDNFIYDKMSNKMRGKLPELHL